MVAIASDGELVLGSMASLIASPSKLFCSDMGDSRRSTVLQNAANRFPVRPRVPCFQFHGARPINLYAVKPPNQLKAGVGAHRTSMLQDLEKGFCPQKARIRRNLAVHLPHTASWAAFFMVVAWIFRADEIGRLGVRTVRTRRRWSDVLSLKYP